MRDRTTGFLLSCKTTDFGKWKLSKSERTFYRRFNKEILSLCRSLPPSAQTDAILFLMQYSEISLGGELDFFSNFYPPAWSILYWLGRDTTPNARQLRKEDATNAVKAQAMAMFLHSLDDHLTDRQVPVSPLTLILRSQAWTIMDSAFRTLAEGVQGGRRTIRLFLDEYYSSMQDSNGRKSLDDYCDLFRKQMALGMVAPMLLSMKMRGMSDFTTDLQIAYGSFGVSWRLLDDVRDIGDDLKRGSHSSLYYCLPKKIRTRWNPPITKNGSGAKNSTSAILNHILECGLIETVKERICFELETAASIVEAYDLIGLAREFRCLAHPLRNSGGSQEKRHGSPGISLAKM